jgi:subtilisin
MPTKKSRKSAAAGAAADNTSRTSSPVDELLLAALERGDDSFETGRYLLTFKEGAAEAGMQSLGVQGMRVADARDFDGQAVTLEDVGDADAVVFPEIGVALVGGNTAQARGLSIASEIAADGPVESIDPEYFMFAESNPSEYLRAFQETESNPNEYLRGFLRAAETIAKDLRGVTTPPLDADLEPLVLGNTWGLTACKVPPSVRSGAGIKVAVLDTGMDLGHPDFVGRSFTTASFVGQPVQDLNGHGTHVIGTACGPKAPAGTTPRYGIGFRTPIFVGKVLTNSGSGTMAGVLNGMNWAIANRCPVISMSLGAQIGVQPAYTNAGQAALNNGLLIIAAAGNAGAATGAPANSPTIMSVASLDRNLTPSSFSNFGKVEIAAPGRDIFSSWPRPTRYRTISGTSMATPHVSGCAALWAETAASLRGINLWRKLQQTARALPFPATRVGAGLVQAP